MLFEFKDNEAAREKMEGSKDFSDIICSNELQGEVPYSRFNINYFGRMKD